MMIAFCTTLLIALASTAAVEVSTSLGDVRGITLNSRSGKEFHAFRGIPYAKPPVGDLRFRNPEPIGAWKPKVLDATKESVNCPDVQYSYMLQQEDCLHLNVFSGNLSANALKPVIVNIHGGALVVKPGEAEPNLLMDRDIVLVTFNYRLGALGFLSTGTVDAPGNAGFKDQVMALKWIQEHIHNFGGDAKSVTLLGYDAGGLSVGLHLVSPMSKGLFHKAIAMSATLFGFQKIPKDQFDLAKKQAELMNCSTTTTEAMMNCLKEMPVREFPETCDALNNNAFFTFLPVVEADFGQERFLIKEPVDELQAGRFDRVPLIIGINKFPLDDLNLSITTLSLKQINENLEKGADVLEQYKSSGKELVGTDFEPNEAVLIKMVFFDGLVGFPNHRFAHLAAKYVPVYFYRFSYMEPQFNDDLKYLLPHASERKSEVDGKTVERLTRMWTQFAKTGNPNNSTDEYLKTLNWEPLASNTDNFLDIGDDLVMKEGLYSKRFDIWEKTHPLVGNGQKAEHGSHSEVEETKP